jgi:hypothetical protein
MTKEQKIMRAKVGAAEAGQAARQCQPSLQNEGLPGSKAFTNAGGELALWELTRRMLILKNHPARRRGNHHRAFAGAAGLRPAGVRGMW